MQTGTITKFSVTFAKNFCKKNKNSCFSNLNTKKITDNKLSKSENIIINECDKTISDEKKICQIFHIFFSNVVSNLDIPNPSNYFKKEKLQSLSAII